MPSVSLAGRRCNLRRVWRDITLLLETLDQLVNQVAQHLVAARVAVESVVIFQKFFYLLREQIIGEQVAFLESAENGFSQLIHGLLRVHWGDAVGLRFEAALQ